MNDSRMPEPKKVGVWAEGTHIEAKEFIIPKKTPDTSTDDIPTIPDLDDLQDILEKEISISNVSKKDTETVEALAEVNDGICSSVEGVEAALEVLKSYIPEVEIDTGDNIWTVDYLLTQLADEIQEV